MQKVKDSLMAALTLLSYLLVGLCFLVDEIPLIHIDTILDAVFKQQFNLQIIYVKTRLVMQCYFAFLFVGLFIGSQYCQFVLYQWDVMIASICHRTKGKSISAIVGRRALVYLPYSPQYPEHPDGQLLVASIRYNMVMQVIDLIFFRDKQHCWNAYLSEQAKGYWDAA